MEIVILVIIIGIFITLISSGKSGSNSIKRETEQQKQAWLREELLERERLAAIQSQQQVEQEREAERKRQQEIIEQQRLKEEKEKATEQQRLAAQRREQELRQQQVAERLAQLTLCETDTAYSTDLQVRFSRNPAGFGFSTIRSICSSQSSEVMQQLRQGVAQLTTYEQLCQYIFAYGKMHQEKLRQSFQSIFIGNHLLLNGQNIEIIDYGCGQGLGTVCFIEFLKSQSNHNWTISNVRLIEPSELALKRGALNVRYLLRSANQTENVYAISKELDNITKTDLGTTNNAVKMHIFSNILDVACFDIQELCEKIVASQQGINLFVCVSPNIMRSRNVRIDQFQEYFKQRGNVTEISHRSSDIPNPSNSERPWRRYERVFKIQLGEQISAANNQMDLITRTKMFEFEDDLPF